MWSHSSNKFETVEERTVVWRWLPDQAPAGKNINIVPIHPGIACTKRLVDLPIAKYPEITFGEMIAPRSTVRMYLVALQGGGHRWNGGVGISRRVVFDGTTHNDG